MRTLRSGLEARLVSPGCSKGIIRECTALRAGEITSDNYPEAELSEAAKRSCAQALVILRGKPGLPMNICDRVQKLREEMMATIIHLQHDTGNYLDTA